VTGIKNAASSGAIGRYDKKVSASGHEVDDKVQFYAGLSFDEDLSLAQAVDLNLVGLGEGSASVALVRLKYGSEAGKHFGEENQMLDATPATRDTTPHARVFRDNEDADHAGDSAASWQAACSNSHWRLGWPVTLARMGVTLGRRAGGPPCWAEDSFPCAFRISGQDSPRRRTAWTATGCSSCET
jgi:hypothetical protein